VTGVTAIVPTWNRRALLERLLGCLARQSQPVEEVLVVDNGSDDGSAEVAERAGARVIRMGSNQGFSRAVNRGIRESHTPWLAIVNNDVEPGANWLERLALALQEPDLWFATGKLLCMDESGSIDGTYDLVSRGACAWRAGRHRKDGPVWSVARRIQFAPFTAALFRAELFRRVGLLDDGFESYLEDVDFGLRCALKGYKGVYVPDAVAYHRGSATLGVWHKDTVQRLARNQVLLVAKHYPRKFLLRYGWPILAGQLLWGLVALRHGAGLACLRGKLEGIRRFRDERAQVRDVPGLGAVLEESEREIRALQKSTGYDLYWRLYFALT
jgi:GT2 family glycosyltransferase